MPRRKIHVPDDEKRPSNWFITHQNQYSQKWLRDRLAGSKEAPVGNKTVSELKDSQEQFNYPNLLGDDN